MEGPPSLPTFLSHIPNIASVSDTSKIPANDVGGCLDLSLSLSLCIYVYIQIYISTRVYLVATDTSAHRPIHLPIVLFMHMHGVDVIWRASGFFRVPRRPRGLEPWPRLENLLAKAKAEKARTARGYVQVTSGAPNLHPQTLRTNLQNEAI